MHTHLCTYALLLEVMPMHWSAFSPTTTFSAMERAGRRELATIFAGWNCTNACSGLPHRWERTLFGKADCHPALVRNGTQNVDVYCVAPGVYCIHTPHARVYMHTHTRAGRRRVYCVAPGVYCIHTRARVHVYTHTRRTST